MAGSNSKIPVLAAFQLKPIKGDDSQHCRGYHVISTAPLNVEGYEKKKPPQNQAIESTRTIDIDVDDSRIAQNNEQILKEQIIPFLRSSSNPEITISVHGYAIAWKDVETRNQRIFAFAKKNYQGGKQVFIGYRWPAENPLQDIPADPNYATAKLGRKIKYAFQSLPTLALQFFGSGVLLGIVTNFLYFWHTFVLPLRPSWKDYTLPITAIVLLLAFGGAWWLIQYSGIQRVLSSFPVWLLGWGMAIAIVLLNSPNPILGFSSFALINLLLAFLSFPVLTLIILRQITYLRDQYRAGSYGVVDLIELLRQIKKYYAQAPNRTEDSNTTDGTAEPKRIKINFIAHSLGCFLVVDLVRVLSDVFNDAAIAHTPGSEIDKVFSLGRLVLVAPDIPVESVLSGRTNFLKASLRRFEESYVFSNEGDLALRLASTVANYIRFPNRTRLRGYKLGNLTIKPKLDEQGKISYGILNLNQNQTSSLPSFLAPELEIRAFKDSLVLNAIGDLASQDDYDATDYFSYFDCTHYNDNRLTWSQETDFRVSQETIRLSNAKENQIALSLWDYLPLSFNYLTQSGKKNWINTHGGYFDGNFTQQMIYGLAFFGLESFTNQLKLPLEPDSLPTPLSILNWYCREKKILGLLSPVVKSFREYY